LKSTASPTKASLTGQSAFLFTKLFVNDKITAQGVFPPEVLEADARDYYLKAAA
jgi:hypothetical protein